MLSSFGKINYEIVKQSELKPGDTFCFEPEKEVNKLKVEDFGIFIGQGSSNTYMFQLLEEDQGLEYIKDDWNNNADKLVVRFLRE